MALIVSCGDNTDADQWRRVDNGFDGVRASQDANIRDAKVSCGGLDSLFRENDDIPGTTVGMKFLKKDTLQEACGRSPTFLSLTSPPTFSRSPADRSC